MRRPKVGLALGAGGARGIAHIGVLKVLKEANIPIDLLAGSSIGSVIAALYASGLDISAMETLASKLKRKLFVDLTIPKLGLISGDRVKELIRILTKGKNIEDLNIPLAIVATNLYDGKEVIFNKGPIDLAVRASISVPGIFEPVIWEKKMLVDGGVIDRVPISVVKDMGADIVIAVDVLDSLNRTKIDNIFDVIAQTIIIMEKEIVEKQILFADFVIYPKVAHISTTKFNNIKECIKKGEEATLKILDKLKEKLEKGVKN